MKEAEIQFISGRKIIVKDIIDYVESQDFDVMVTKDEEHITVFRNSVEYMIVKDIEFKKESLSLDKGCSNCAYKEREFTESPCNECYCSKKEMIDHTEDPKWKKEEK